VTHCKNFRRYNAKRPPKCNCDSCWAMYWNTHPGRFSAIDNAISMGHKKEVTGMVGDKYVQKFEKFRRMIDNAVK
jgi:hypothetical protein